jgi:hypothetical protein
LFLGNAQTPPYLKFQLTQHNGKKTANLFARSETQSVRFSSQTDQNLD